MNAARAAELRMIWQASGKDSCAHPLFDKEYEGGSDTGDMVCCECGNTFDPEDVKRIRAEREKREAIDR